MERADFLLEKYFRGETTLVDENELKQYFKSTDVSAEHVMYGPLFMAFDEELKEKSIAPVENKPEQKRFRIAWIQTFVYTGIAAAIAVIFWFQRSNQPLNLAVVNGDKIQDTEYAQKYAEKKLMKVHNILEQSMKPMDNIEKVRKDLQPLQKISNSKNQTDKQIK